MGPGKHENVGESQSVLIMINRMISSRTRTALRWEALHCMGSGVQPFPAVPAQDRIGSRQSDHALNLPGLECSFEQLSHSLQTLFAAA
jgi:hypothetical protein